MKFGALLTFVSTVIVYSVVYSSVSLACDCVPSSESQNLKNADLVFVGTALTSPQMESVGGPHMKTDFQIVSLEKGAAEDIVGVYVPWTDCFIRFRKNQTYRVYAKVKNGIFVTNDCQGNKLLSSERTE